MRVCVLCSLLAIMRPLGLPATRLAAIRGIARDFLAAPWREPREFKRACVHDEWQHMLPRIACSCPACPSTTHLC